MTLDPALIGKFSAIVGAPHALTREQDIEPHVMERRGQFGGKTSLVLLPQSTSQVAQIMTLASASLTPVVPQGGNTGLVGGQMPDRSGGQLILSMRRMNRIREVDPASGTITAEAGVVLHDLQDAAERAGRLFPLSLASQGSCQIGGNLSSNAGGTGVLAYGNARDLCLGLEVVLPDGRVFDDLRKLRKDNTGYDLKNLFIGAEGTLGVITAAVLKLFPRPAGREVAWVGLDSPRAALELYQQAAERAGPALTAFELISARAAEFSIRHGLQKQAPLAGRHAWQVMLEYSSHVSSSHASRELEALLSPMIEHGPIADAVISRTTAQYRALWEIREFMSEAQRHEGLSIKHDISVPVAALPQLIDKAGRAVLQLQPAARIVCFGHMGDGNLHYNISQPEGGDAASFRQQYAQISRAVHDVVLSLGGSISAEHGIGQMKRDELVRSSPPIALELMRAIKQVIDPAGIMNPGKVI